MSTKQADTKEGIEKRTIRAATESMSIDRHAGEAGKFDVYSESGSVYQVCLITETCDCPSATYQDGACKHRVAVAIREPVLAAASEYECDRESAVATDGGTATDRPADCEHAQDQREQTEGSRPADCDCLPTFEDLPCWPCYREGFRTPNPKADTED